MSARSTPRASTSHLPRTPSFSSDHSHDPSTSRRHTRTDSLRLPTLAESSVHSSGLSTPETRRRRYQAKKNSNVKQIEVDWAEVEPDEVFRRLPVQEVRRVEQKMRTDALNKQSELRAMVGTRYRDLLTSATQITTLRSSSLRLSSSLKSIAQACANPTDTTQYREDVSDTTETTTADIMSVLPVAAHVKLLLDAPEALYSYLAHHSFLDAAYLWLVARVAKEGLSSMPADVSGPYLSLAEKQWETMVPFRSQIVNRASASLRSRDKTDTKTLSETLLAIILLDNLTLSDALDLLLAQRTKAVRDILQHTESSGLSAPNSARRRRSSVISRDKEQIAQVLKEAVSCLIETTTLASSVFEKRRKLDSDSVLEEMIRLVQKTETAPALNNTPSSRRTSHERRASRLASISSPLPKLSFSSTASPVTASKVLQGLPSAQILLRHLPASITTFTPFITVSAPPAVFSNLAEWRTTSTKLLAEAVPSWLTALQSIQDVWAVRSTLVDGLAEGEFQTQIQSALANEWADRAKGIWTTKLDSIVNTAQTKLEEVVTSIQKGQAEEESDVDSFAFSDLAYPTIPPSALAGASTSLQPFLASLRQRSSGRTPLLDGVLGSLESAAAALRKDSEGLVGDLRAQYQSGVGEALRRLVNVLRDVLRSIAQERSVECSLFVGRVALYLATTSSVFGDLANGIEDITDDLKTIHKKSTSAWASRITQAALLLLSPIFSPENTPSIIKLSWQADLPSTPSPEIMIALQSLVAATRLLGIPQATETGVVKDMVRSFVQQARGLEGWKGLEGECAVQGAVDLGFLNLISGDKPIDPTVEGLLAKIPSSIPSDFRTNLPTILADHLRRTQLLLYPLIRHVPESSLPPTTSSTARKSSYLRLGPATVGEFRSPVAVAKPGKRFGLLSIAV